MNTTDAIITHRLHADESRYLNDFLALGWRILEIEKDRRPRDDGFYEELSFLLGSDRLVEVPEKYRKAMEANRVSYEPPPF